MCVASNIGVRGERDLAMMHAASSEELEEDKKKKHTYGCTRERARSYSIPQWLKLHTVEQQWTGGCHKKSPRTTLW